MAEVSLIFTLSRQGNVAPREIADARTALESAGYDVEIILAARVGCRPEASGSEDLGLRIVEASTPGRAASAIAGLSIATGERLLVVDPERGYDPTDLLAVVLSMEPSAAEVAVASRLMQAPGSTPIVLPKAFLGRFLHRLTGSTDPLSGLVGMTRPALQAALDDLEPVGSQFSLELLTKARCRRLDVPATPSTTGRRGRPGFDDVRHLKHLADFRFGNVSRLMQFCVVGASGMVIDLTCYALFQILFYASPLLASTPVSPTQVPWALALARGSAIAVALVWNFSLNRRMTFSYARGGSIFRQFLAYAASNLLGITVSMLLSLGLPSRVAFFHDHKLMAALVGIVAATGISFSMSRWLVFRGSGPTPAPRSAHPVMEPRSRFVETAPRESVPAS